MRSGSRCPAFYGEIPPMRWGILDDDSGYFYCITYSIADAARAREEMAAGMAEALRRFRQLMQDVPLDARTVVHRDEMERHSLRMAAEVLKVAAVQQPHHLLIGIEQAVRFLSLRNIETAGQVLHDARELP